MRFFARSKSIEVKIALTAVFFLSSCFSISKKPGSDGVQTESHELTVKKMKKKYPEGVFLVSWGEGVNRMEALSKAKAEIASRLNSELKSSLKVQRKLQSGEQSSESTHSVSLDIESTSGFTHAELIKTAEGSEHIYEDQVLVLAVLDKRDLKITLQKDYDKSSVSFRPACAKAVQLGQDRDQPAMCGMIDQVRDTYQKLDHVANQWYAVFRGYPPDFSKDEACYQAAISKLEQLVVAKVVTVDLEGVSRESSASVLSALRQQLGGFGFSVSEGNSCNAGVLLKVYGRPSCDMGMIGYECKIGLEADLLSCSKERQRLGRTNLGYPKGIHPSDEKQAMNRLMTNVSSMDLKTAGRYLQDVTGGCLNKSNGNNGDGGSREGITH